MGFTPDWYKQVQEKGKAIAKGLQGLTPEKANDLLYSLEHLQSLKPIKAKLFDFFDEFTVGAGTIEAVIEEQMPSAKIILEGICLKITSFNGDTSDINIFITNNDKPLEERVLIRGDFINCPFTTTLIEKNVIIDSGGVLKVTVDNQDALNDVSVFIRLVGYYY